MGKQEDLEKKELEEFEDRLAKLEKEFGSLDAFYRLFKLEEAVKKLQVARAEEALAQIGNPHCKTCNDKELIKHPDPKYPNWWVPCPDCAKKDENVLCPHGKEVCTECLCAPKKESCEHEPLPGDRHFQYAICQKCGEAFEVNHNPQARTPREAIMYIKGLEDAKNAMKKVFDKSFEEQKKYSSFESIKWWALDLRKELFGTEDKTSTQEKYTEGADTTSGKTGLPHPERTPQIEPRSYFLGAKAKKEELRKRFGDLVKKKWPFLPHSAEIRQEVFGIEGEQTNQEK